MPAIRRLRLALLGLASVVGIGVAGYVLLEHWHPFDALYMTIITMATIGYGEVKPLTQAGRAFTIFLILAGAASVTYTAAVYVELLVGDLFKSVVEQRRMDRELDKIRDHYLVCGYGRMGQEIVEQFARRNIPYVVVELSEEKCRRLADRGALYVTGDASDDAVLKKAGIERAKGLISVAPRDADNVFITLSARALKADLFIVARSIYDADVHKLQVAGANRVISPYVIGGRRIASAVFEPTVVDFLDMAIRDETVEWELTQVHIDADSCFAGSTLRDCRIRELSGCTILAVRGPDGKFDTNPSPDSLLPAGAQMVVLGTRAQLGALGELTTKKKS